MLYKAYLHVQNAIVVLARANTEVKLSFDCIPNLSRDKSLLTYNMRMRRKIPFTIQSNF